jgi:hypothetical protein
MRLACVGGVLTGLDDVSPKVRLENEGWRRSVEDEAVVALAEIMDIYVQTEGGWEKEFQPETEKGEGAFELVKSYVANASQILVDALSLALILASQSLPLVSSEKLTALPLPVSSLPWAHESLR